MRGKNRVLDEAGRFTRIRPPGASGKTVGTALSALSELAAPSDPKTGTVPIASSRTRGMTFEKRNMGILPWNLKYHSGGRCRIFLCRAR
jgi:hypothetical protein